jgi:putative transposase
LFSLLLHMDSDQLERRQAAIWRLLGLRRDGWLTSEIVEAAAVSLGVDCRTVWRWVAAGEYEPGQRTPWQTTPAAIEALYLAAGRPTTAWRLLREDGIDVPSHSTFCRAIERDVSPAERAYARHGEDGRRRFEVYRRWEPGARNEVWQADHAELDLEVLPLRGQRLVRPWLTIIEDAFSRLVMGWALSLRPSTAEVLAAMREAIVIDPDRGPWGGVPQLVRFDGGREFLARAVTRAAGELGCAALPTAAYSPYQKGKVERLHRTIGEGLIAGLPHYTGGPRKRDGALYAQPAPLTLAQLQTRLRDFIDSYNTEHRHSALGGLTPAQKWASSAVALDVVEPDRLRWMLMADQTRRVLKDGIHFGGEIFIAPELARVGGCTVQVRYTPHDLRAIEIFTDNGWLCTAHPQDVLSREQAEAVVMQRHEAAREMGRRKAAASRKARTRLAPMTGTGAIEDVAVITARTAGQPELEASDQQTGELLHVLGLADRLNTAITGPARERA